MGLVPQCFGAFDRGLSRFIRCFSNRNLLLAGLLRVLCPDSTWAPKWERYLVTNQGYDNNYGAPGSTSAPDCAYCGYLASAPGSMIGAFVYNVPDAGILSQYLPNAPRQWVGLNPYLNLAALSNPATLSQLPAATQASLLQYYNNYFLPTYDPATYNQIVETNKSAYVKASLKGQVFDQPWALDLGLRYVHTNTVSVANFQQLLGLNVGPNGCNNCGQYGPLQPQSASGEYSYVLPSAKLQSKRERRPGLPPVGVQDAHPYRPCSATSISIPVITPGRSSTPSRGAIRT